MARVDQRHQQQWSDLAHSGGDSGGGRANDSETELWPVLWVSVHGFVLSDARGEGGGLARV